MIVYGNIKSNISIQLLGIIMYMVSLPPLFMSQIYRLERKLSRLSKKIRDQQKAANKYSKNTT
ncbi:MAG: hypothetical protein DRH57_06470 [Candidatus Cloacimonadota bacterium]|nr:MAG: hypothetical protein DRH57_06470 [Candidatus Cloacimonadota bacterium]